MTSQPDSMILEAYCVNHQRILTFAENLTEAQLHWQLSPDRLNIAFFLWHLGRWADHLQAAIPGMTPELSQRLPPGQQVWERQQLSQAWGFAQVGMGYAETGMDMSEADAVQLKFPSSEMLLKYVRQAFAEAEKAVQAIDEDQFQAAERPQPMTEGIWTPGGSVGGAVFSHLMHDVLHFGMMHQLLAQQG